MTESQGPYILGKLPSYPSNSPQLTHRPKVSGANRGIGFALVEALLAKLPRAIIFAGARDPSSADALHRLSQASKSKRLFVVKLIVNDEASNKDAVEEIRKVTDRLDIVVANAGTRGCCSSAHMAEELSCLEGVHSSFGPIHTCDPKLFNSNFEVNTLGPLLLYQATYPLLFESRTTTPSLRPPKFFVTSSLAGSIGGVPPMFITAIYGGAKAAANYLVHSIHQQTEGSDAVLIAYHPGKSTIPLMELRCSYFTDHGWHHHVGLVATDMLFTVTKELGMTLDQLPGVIQPEECAQDYADLVIRSTRAEHGGKFLGCGFPEPIPW